MTETLAAPVRPIVDKRAALLAAALRLIARSGLQATTTAAVAREAGVAAGTLYLYFPSKEALVNALYLEVLEEHHRVVTDAVEDPAAGAADSREGLWRTWHALARWFLDHPGVSRVLQQCRTSGILTDVTRDAEHRIEQVTLARFREAIVRGAVRDLPLLVFSALFMGPIHVLAEAAGAGGVASVTDAVLRTTFEGVCRGVLLPDDAAPRAAEPPATRTPRRAGSTGKSPRKSSPTKK
jgi:AcrR family transcriptional regulator